MRPRHSLLIYFVASCLLVIAPGLRGSMAEPILAPDSAGAAGTGEPAVPSARAEEGVEQPPRGTDGSPLPKGEAEAIPTHAYRDIPLRSKDGHEFIGSYYTPGGDTPGPGVLLIPHLGHTRQSLSGLSSALVAKGYRVLAMDNTGQMRSVTRGPRGVPTFKPFDRKLFDQLLFDVPPAIDALKHQSGVSSQISVVGFGTGANLALEYSAATPEVSALALVMPGYGCEEFKSLDSISDYGRRPLLLIESKKRFDSDMTKAFKLMTRIRNDASIEQVVLPRDPSSLLSNLGSGLEGSVPLIDWMNRVVPAVVP